MTFLIDLGAYFWVFGFIPILIKFNPRKAPYSLRRDLALTALLLAYLALGYLLCTWAYENLA